MEQFSYEEWVKNPQRKVVTRTGEEVIVKGFKKNYDHPVEVERSNGNYDYYTKDGLFVNGARDERDLFFADDIVDKAQPIAQPEANNGLFWRKCTAGHKFPSDAIVIPDDERTTDRDPRLVRCAIWDSIYILVSDLKNLPIEE